MSSVEVNRRIRAIEAWMPQHQRLAAGTRIFKSITIAGKYRQSSAPRRSGRER